MFNRIFDFPRLHSAVCGRYVRRGWVVGKWGVWLDLARSARHCIYPIGEQPTLLMHIANQHKWDIVENKIRVQDEVH